ncbi:hypothetical protein SAMN02982931_00206 [Bauldia litoralis]|uniref:Uncharacterized protein n=1 Tax=Bauldia litoralis TaxID=665467 RepID=A0A1G6A5N9_9HYPH|nr:hypothetical protein SAMN02982931_00206 [Bauldia litoralis]
MEVAAGPARWTARRRMANVLVLRSAEAGGQGRRAACGHRQPPTADDAGPACREGPRTVQQAPPSFSDAASESDANEAGRERRDGRRHGVGTFSQVRRRTARAPRHVRRTKGRAGRADGISRAHAGSRVRGRVAVLARRPTDLVRQVAGADPACFLSFAATERHRQRPFSCRRCFRCYDAGWSGEPTSRRRLGPGPLISQSGPCPT